MHDLSRSSCFHRCRRDLQYDEGRRGGGERWVVQIALLTRTRCTMCSDRSRGEKPREAEDSKDRRYVLPHPARDFRQPFSRFRVIPYASILVWSLHNTKVLGDRKKVKRKIETRITIFAKNNGHHKCRISQDLTLPQIEKSEVIIISQGYYHRDYYLSLIKSFLSIEWLHDRSVISLWLNYDSVFYLDFHFGENRKIKLKLTQFYPDNFVR